MLQLHRRRADLAQLSCPASIHFGLDSLIFPRDSFLLMNMFQPLRLQPKGLIQVLRLRRALVSADIDGVKEECACLAEP